MARFEKGTGKLQRRKKNGRHVGNWFFKFEGRRINTDAADRAEAEAFRRKFLGDIERGLRQARTRKVAVNELLDLVLGDYQARIRAAKSEDAKVAKQ